VGRLLALSAGHLITDVNQGAVIILVPVVKASLGLSIGAATLLVTVSTIASSVVQPLFGALSDRFDLRWLIPGGVLLAGLGVAVAGVAPNYALVLVGVLVSGVGVAAFHPESARWAGEASGPMRATGMSWFSVGGNAGFALGVLITAPLVSLTGSRAGVAWLVVPSVILTVYLAWLMRGFRARESGSGEPLRSALMATLTPAMGLLIGFILVRSVVSVGFATFTPLYLTLVRHLTLTEAAAVTFAHLFAGAVGTLIGGPVADRIGRKATLLWTFLLMPPLGLAFVWLPGLPGYVALTLMGALIISTFAVTITMAQELMPRHQGTASGLTIGFAIGMGGVAVALLGRLADAVGLTSTLVLLSLSPIAGLLLILPLQETKTTSGTRLEHSHADLPHA
jgi:FSR family fosmidomycin resistance protein-like MFS transporter